MPVRFASGAAVSAVLRSELDVKPVNGLGGQAQRHLLGLMAAHFSESAGSPWPSTSSKDSPSTESADAP